MLVDDETISDDSVLYRRVPAQPKVYMVWNYNTMCWVISSQAFKNHKENRLAFSVHLKEVVERLGLSLDAVVQDRSKFALASLTARQVREHRQVINRMPEPGDPAHAHVLGEKPGSVQRALATVAVWVLPPTNLPPQGPG